MKRILSVCLTCALLLGMLPLPALALEPDSEGLCPHHTEHSYEVCGYMEAVEGQPCGHVHDGDCGFAEAVAEIPCDMGCAEAGEDGQTVHAGDCAYTPAAEEIPCDMGCAEAGEDGQTVHAGGCAYTPAAEEIPCDMGCAEAGEDGQTVHDEGCAYTPAAEGAPCLHEHDGECGYVPAGPGQPCGYDCRICPVQKLLDALPDAEDVTADNRAGAEAQLAAIDGARAELTDEEAGELDTSRYQAVVSALAALDEQGGAEVPMPAATEQFPTLTPGETYWFDLSGADIPGRVNTGTIYNTVAVPDTTLHWVPFTYVGTINAYKLTSAQATTDEYADTNKYDHSLFVADYDVQVVSWSALDTKDLIFGKDYTSGGVSYTMRAPSAGSASTGSVRATPQSNEWDMILNKSDGYIKNRNGYSWGQDISSSDTLKRALRGGYLWNTWDSNYATYGYSFRPVLELPAPDQLSPDSLKVVTLDLNGGKAGTTNTAQSGPAKIVVKSGDSFTAPSGEGLTAPQETGKLFKFSSWEDSDGMTYRPGEDIPSTVTKLTAQWVAVEEQLPALTPGETYWFDLSGAGIPGTVNSKVPDTTLHWVPFTYAGTIYAYKLTSAQATTDEYANQNKYDHSLFIADYNVTNKVSWNDLNGEDLIFGEAYTSGSVSYTMRAPSVGSDYTGSDDNIRGLPQSNEWDMILNKSDGYIKNWGRYSWGQDTYSFNPSNRAVRGDDSARHGGNYSATGRDVNVGFRPVLELPAPDTLTSGLQVVTLDLNGGEIGSKTGPVNIVVKSGDSFTAPSSDGFSAPEWKYAAWTDSSGTVYEPGDIVPAGVTELTAQWKSWPPCTVTVESSEGGTAFAIPTLATPGDTVTLTAEAASGFHFLKWEVLSGDVTISNNSFIMPNEDVTVRAVFEIGQFPNLAPGEIYWFDLSRAGIPGTVNSKVPDTTLHWVPFTYTGTIYAYSRSERGVSTDATVTPYEHSLFIADYNVTNNVSESDLNGKALIFGKPYTSGGVDYTMRAPSAGSASTGSDDNERGTPQSNEWDMILNKLTGDIKNWSGIRSWGQDTSSSYSSHRAVRGYHSARYWDGYDDTYRYATVGFRPVLELPAPDALTPGLRVVTLDLNGGKIGSETGPVNIVVKSGEGFTAPSGDGLTIPEWMECFDCWTDSSGKTYAAKTEVPAGVTELTAQWKSLPECTVTVQTSGNGTASASLNSAIPGTEIILTAEADSGYWFEGWEVISGDATIVDNRFTMPAEDVTIRAVFVTERISALTPGETYWFDLSGADIPGTVNSKVPDTTLHWTPFTYTGTINAYKLDSPQATTDEYADTYKYDHSLFIADYNVTNQVSWNNLNGKALIFGKDYTSGGVSYTMRAPSAGSGSTGSGDSRRGIPESNEWDAILDKNAGYIKNWNAGKNSWGQDTSKNDSSKRALRGCDFPRFWYSDPSGSSVYTYRPVLELPTPDTLTSGLRVVTLDLNGGKIGSETGPVNIVVKSGENFTAPSGNGLTAPSEIGKLFIFSGWESGGITYQPDETVPSTVTKLTAQWVALEEQFPTLTPGKTYWFDLSEANIPGAVNTGNSYGAVAVPDTTLHWVPFTYTGTIYAYSRSERGVSTDATVTPYEHSLFIADYNVTNNVSESDLNGKALIFGKPYTSGGVDYTMRAPSAGSASTGSDDNERGTPQSNEWDMILNKLTGDIKNWSGIRSWGQDTSSSYSSHRAVRGYHSARYWDGYDDTYRYATVGFRPVLELPAPDALTPGLRVVTLDLNGGKIGSETGPVNIVVKSGEDFTAPGGEGLTVPDGKPAFSGWLDDDGVLYSAGDHVPATVTKLTARWGLDLADADITLSSNHFTYNGQAQTPAVTVTLYGKTLAQGKDYTVSYTDNTNAGTATATLTGTGSCSGTVTKSFEIAPKEITAALTGTTSKPYDGTMNPPTGLLLTLDGVISGENVTAAANISYNSANVNEANTITASGITLAGATKDNYLLASSTVSVTGSITKSQPVITFSSSYAPDKAYDGQEIGNPGASDLTVTGAAFADVEFTWSATPQNAGTYTLTATIPATDNTETATATKTVTISRKTVNSPAITVTPSQYEYTGEAITPNNVVVKDGGQVIPSSEYTLSYSGNTEVGTAAVTVTDVPGGNYAVSGSGTFVITGRSLKNAAVTVSGDGLTYNGQAQTPAVTVTLDGKTLTQGTDYTVSYSDNTNAGTATVTVTGTGNYEGTPTARTVFSIAKKELTIEEVSASGRAYDGTAQVPITSVTLSGAVPGDDVSVDTSKLTGTIASPDVGTYSSVTLPALSLTGGKADCYSLNWSGGSIAANPEVAITKAAAPAAQTGTMDVRNGRADIYRYDLTRLLPTLDSGKTLGAVSYSLGAVSITEGYYDSGKGAASVSGTALILPIQAVSSEERRVIGTVSITISSANYTDMTATIQVEAVNRTPVTISAAIQNGTFNGQPQSGCVSGITSVPAYSGSYEITYTGTGYSSATPPTNAGEYTVTIKIPESDPEYVGSIQRNFTIHKAAVTVAALNKTADTGGAAPDLTSPVLGRDYTVSGLVGGDLLRTPPVLSYATTPDMSSEGSYAIVPSGAAVPATGNYEDEITYQNGTLSVRRAPVGVSGITLDRDVLVIVEGETATLTATIQPPNADNTTVSWSSSNSGVAIVDSTGKITAIREGEAVITATTADGGRTASCKVKVRKELPNPPTSSGGTQLRLVMETGISEVPAGLQSINELNTPAKLETAMRAEITQATSGIPQANTAVYDVALMVSTDGGATWTPATAGNFPSGGLTVTLPYPSGTNSSYRFTVVHMFTTTDFGKTPGATEVFTPDKVKNTAQGLQVVLTGLSPISVGWTAPATTTDPPSGGNHGGGGWSSSSYAVTVEKSEHGKVTSNRVNASGGSTVTLTVTPDSGYVLDTLTVSDSLGNKIKLTAQGGGKYTFTMPSRAVTVKAAFAPLPIDVEKPCDGGASCPSHSFTDLGSVGTWYHEAVDYVLRHGLMGGYGNGLFGPDNNLSRAQFAQILFNKEGRPLVDYLLQYGDVAEGAWYTEAIRWATSQGIISGYGNGMFGPDDPITREQLAVMLWRYAGSPAATNKELHFSDESEISGYALEALRWAVENGILNGYGDGRLGPQGQATRAQVAQMLKNFIESRENDT